MQDTPPEVCPRRKRVKHQWYHCLRQGKNSGTREESQGSWSLHADIYWRRKDWRANPGAGMAKTWRDRWELRGPSFPFEQISDNSIQIPYRFWRNRGMVIDIKFKYIFFFQLRQEKSNGIKLQDTSLNFAKVRIFLIILSQRKWDFGHLFLKL